jgi:hypothetical protein
MVIHVFMLDNERVVFSDGLRGYSKGHATTMMIVI